jgi:regulatory protein
VAFGRAARRVDEHRAASADAVRTGALALLARREYASAELITALVRKGYSAPVVKDVVATLAGEGMVDDVRYAGSLVRMLVGRGQGPLRISRQLRDAGIAEDQIAAALDEGLDWYALAAEVRQRKFGADVPKGWPARAKQMRFLQYRGFSGDHVSQALGHGDPQESASELS